MCDFWIEMHSFGRDILQGVMNAAFCGVSLKNKQDYYFITFVLNTALSNPLCFLCQGNMLFIPRLINRQIKYLVLKKFLIQHSVYK